jgi:alkylhydroperoxidase family enzyme
MNIDAGTESTLEVRIPPGALGPLGRVAAWIGGDPRTPVRVMEGAGADGWSPRQRALLLATDELHELRVISDATWALLAEELGELELLELCFLVGHYEMVAMALNSLGVEPEPTTLDRLEADNAAATNTLLRILATRRRNASSQR